MNPKVTNHAIERRFEKFKFLYNDDEINKEKLHNDIIDDFSNSVIFGETRNAALFKSKYAFYVVMYENKIPVIITTYPVIQLPENYDISILENIRIVYKGDVLNEERKIIEPIIKTEDYFMVKHEGHKKLIWSGGFLLFCNMEFNKEYVYYYILKKWTLEDLKNKDIQRIIYSTYFNSDFKWNDFLKKINLLDFIYNPTKNEHLPPEIITYKQVLNGELKIFPNGFWQEDIGGEIKIAAQLCTKYMIEEILNWNVYEICALLKISTFKKHKLGGMLEVLFKKDIFEALNNTYPNKYPIGMVKNANTINYWKKENDGVNHAKKALEWVVEDCKKDGLIINKKVLLNYNWDQILKKYHLLKILKVTFENNLKDFLEQVFDVKISDEEHERRFNILNKKPNQYIKTHF